MLEAVEVLRGKPGDLRTICVALSANLLALCHGWSLEEAERKVCEALDSGLALQTMKAWIAAQGGDPDFEKLPRASIIHPVKAPQSGWLTHMDAAMVGISSSVLGAGRMKKEDAIDYAAGIVLEKKTGDYVWAGETLAWLHTNRADLLQGAETQFLQALTWGTEAPLQQPLIFGNIR